MLFSNIEINFLILYLTKSLDNLSRSSSGITLVQSLFSIFDIVSWINFLFGIYLDLPDQIIALKTINQGFVFKISKCLL